MSCMSSSPERPAMASLSANGSFQLYVRVRSATGETLATHGVALSARFAPARSSHWIRGRLR